MMNRMKEKNGEIVSFRLSDIKTGEDLSSCIRFLQEALIQYSRKEVSR